jgi:hypothetical protein
MDTDTIILGLNAAAEDRPPTIRAETFIKRFTTASQPVILQCEGDQIYVVKGQHAGRAIFNDQVIARLGCKMDAPVGLPALIFIPPELQQNEPQMQGLIPGIAHGTLYVSNTTEREWLLHTDKHYNRPRFALLSIMYGWLCANDHQLIYCNQEPNLVYSVDHGHFFPHGPTWTIEVLATAAPVEPYLPLRGGCGLADSEIGTALVALANVTDNDIVGAVGLPPEEWNVSQEERIALVHFIISRRDTILANFNHLLRGG